MLANKRLEKKGEEACGEAEDEFWDQAENLFARARERWKHGGGKAGSSLKQSSGSHRAAHMASSSPMSESDCCQPR